MFILEAKIEIGAYVFNSIHEVEITKSVDELGDTALIKLPTRFKVKDRETELYTEEALKAGDAVKITLGYEGRYSGVEFEGYVKKISPKVPLEIQCEDSIWLLRRKNITRAWNDGTTVRNLLEEVVKGTALELSDAIPDIKLDKWIVKNANGAQVLQKLKEEMSLSVFIDDDGKLYCGLQQATNIGQVVKYDLNYNLVENDLEFRTREERRIKLRYTYIDGENNKKTVEIGDPDGELRTYHTSVISDPEKLRAMGEAEIERLKYDGYDGDVTSFLIPFATRGMKAEIIDQEHPQRDGGYFIKKVVTTMGTQGARRKVTVGNRI